jgi:nicotinamidase-related amidase
MSQTATKTALLVMDVQQNIVDRYARGDELLTALSEAIATARHASMPVIYVVVAFRPGYPEVSARNRIFAGIRERSQTAPFSVQETAIHPAVAPEPQDIVVTKRRVSAFSGSDLEVVLRAQEITHLVLTGIATSGVVLSTLREAADRDYQLTVLSDCCADNDGEVQRILLSRIFPRQAEVVSLAAWRAQVLGQQAATDGN